MTTYSNALLPVRGPVPRHPRPHPRRGNHRAGKLAARLSHRKAVEAWQRYMDARGIMTRANVQRAIEALRREMW
jgi:uncharacterized protein with WD repeat